MSEKKVGEVIAISTIRKTLGLSDIMLKIFRMAIRTKPGWVKQSLSRMLANASTEPYIFFKTECTRESTTMWTFAQNYLFKRKRVGFH